MVEKRKPEITGHGAFHLGYEATFSRNKTFVPPFLVQKWLHHFSLTKKQKHSFLAPSMLILHGNEEREEQNKTNKKKK